MTVLTKPTITYQIEFQEAGQYDISLSPSLSQEQPAVYTTLRTYHGIAVLNWHEHMSRLFDSSSLLGFSFPCDSDTLKSILRNIVGPVRQEDVRLRIVAPKAVSGQTPTLAISLEPLPDYPYRGYIAYTHQGQREQARAKNYQFTHTAETIRKQYPANAEEVLLVAGSGEILEGLSSNFYAIHAGILYTAGEGVLSGTTRTAILNLSKQIGIEQINQGWNINRLGELSEAFITSVSRGVLPITRIDQQIIGDGNPGEVTSKIHAAYLRWVEDHLETL
jgi:branched-chain amino acid aminotransferase